jgi:hypothetical protein
MRALAQVGRAAGLRLVVPGGLGLLIVADPADGQQGAGGRGGPMRWMAASHAWLGPGALPEGPQLPPGGKGKR